MPRSNKPEETQESSSEQRLDCRNRALGLLARREHSRLELTRKLISRSYSTETVEAVLNELQDERLLEESRFVESFVRARVGRGQGPSRIRAELIQRGIDEPLIQTGLRDAPYDWTALAVEARRKRFGLGAPDGFAERARQARFLQNRGVEGGQIHAALDLEPDSD